MLCRAMFIFLAVLTSYIKPCPRLCIKRVSCAPLLVSVTSLQL